MEELEILIPVHYEAANIIPCLDSLEKSVSSRFSVILCYDDDEDNTISAVQSGKNYSFNVRFVKNYVQRGLHGAVRSGILVSTAPTVLIMPADDMVNAPLIDKMLQMRREGAEIVCPSRFMKGGEVSGYPKFRYFVVRFVAVLLYRLALIPTHDPTNGFRLFSRRVLDTITVESTVGGAYSIEFLVKAHRLGWGIKEIPASWIERSDRKSSFKMFKWAPQYLKWFFYAFATTYFNRSLKG